MNEGNKNRQARKQKGRSPDTDSHKDTDACTERRRR